MCTKTSQNWCFELMAPLHLLEIYAKWLLMFNSCKIVYLHHEDLYLYWSGKCNGVSNNPRIEFFPQ